MYKKLLVSLFAGVVLISSSAQAAMDTKVATKVASEEKQVQEADDVAALVKKAEPIVMAKCKEQIAELEAALAKLELHKNCGVMSVSAYNAQKRDLEADLEVLRKVNATELVTAMINEAIEQGPESAAGLKLLTFAVACEGELDFDALNSNDDNSQE